MKKKIIALLMAALIVCLLLPVQSFAAVIIKGAYKGVALEKSLGEIQGANSFSLDRKKLPDGLDFKADYKYNSKIEKDILFPVVYGTPTKAGTYEFSISYYKTAGGEKLKTVTYSMTVGEESPFDYVLGNGYGEHKLEIVHEPYKTRGYYINEALDPSGLKVEVLAMKDGKEIYVDVTELCSLSPTVFTYDEGQDVTVSLFAPDNKKGHISEFTASFRIVDFAYANPTDVTSIAVKTEPTKTTYAQHEKLDTEGLVLTVTYGSGDKKDITEGFTCDVTTLETVGEQIVNVTYKEKTASFTVNVTEPVIVSDPKLETVAPPEPVTVPEPVVEEPVEEPEPVVEEPEPIVSEPEPVVEEPEFVEASADEPEEEKASIPFWVWLIIGVLAAALAAVLGLYFLGKKRIGE